MKPSQYHTAAPWRRYQLSQFVSPAPRTSVDRDPHDAGKRLPGGWALEQVLVPVCRPATLAASLRQCLSRPAKA